MIWAKMRMFPFQTAGFGVVARIRRRLPQYLKTAVRDPSWVIMFILARLVLIRYLLKAKTCPSDTDSHRTSLLLDVDGSARDIVSGLNRDGIAPGLRLRPQVIAEIRKFAATAPCYAAADLARPVLIPATHEAGPPLGTSGALIADYRDEVLKCPAIVSLWSDPLLLAIAANYLRHPPRLKRSRLWWTFSGQKGDVADLATFSIDHYHYDLDDWLCLKFFFYITDTDAGSGPHAFIRGSHARRRLSHQLTTFKGHSREKLAAFYAAQDFLLVTGPTGFGFAEDPFGFHTGTTPISRNRLILEIEYGVTGCAVAAPQGAGAVT
jgi:hypothetical protein